MFSTIIVFCGRIVNDKFFATMKTRRENRQIVVFCAGKGHILQKKRRKYFFLKRENCQNLYVFAKYCQKNSVVIY